MKKNCCRFKTKQDRHAKMFSPPSVCSHDHRKDPCPIRPGF